MSEVDAMSPTSFGNRFRSTVMSALAFNLLTKIGTFALTTVLTRSVTADSRGVGFTMEVYTNTLLFIAREAVRVTNARNVVDPNGPASIAKVANTGALTIVLGACGLLLSYFCATVLQVADPLFALGFPVNAAALDGSVVDASFVPPLWLAVFVGGLLLELISEPIQALASSFLLFKTRIAAESLGLGLRLVTVTGLFVGMGEGNVDPLLTFALGQFVYGLTILAFMYSKLRETSRAVAPSADWAAMCATAKAQKAWFVFVSPDAMRLAAKEQFTLWTEFFGETLLRLALTEGERVVLTVFGELKSRGIYEVVTNLSNLFARLIFRVWEDACFNAWTKMATSLQGKREAGELLQKMLRFSLYLGSVFAVFGPPMAKTVLTVLYTSKWADEESVAVMSASCVLTPLLGINGLTEAFVRATASTKLLQQVKLMMLGTGLVYIVGSYLALNSHGVVGLMYANCANMAVRICGSAYVIHQTLKVSAKELGQILFGLHYAVGLASAGLYVVCRMVPIWCVVFLCAPVYLAVVLRFDDSLWPYCQKGWNAVLKKRRSD